MENYPPIAQNLSKPGALITLKENDPRTIPELMEDGIITQELMRIRGFALVRGRTTKYEVGEASLGVSVCNEDPMHKDSDGGMVYPYLTLSLYSGNLDRPAWTAIGEVGEVFRRSVEFMKTIEIPPVIQNPDRSGYISDSDRFRLAIEGREADQVFNLGQGDKGFTFGHEEYTQLRVWGEFVFVGGRVFRYLPDPGLSKLNQHLSPWLYKHVWQPGDTLLIDNHAMVHGRIPYPDCEATISYRLAAVKDKHPKPPVLGDLNRRFVRWNEEGRVEAAWTNFSGDRTVEWYLPANYPRARSSFESF